MNSPANHICRNIFFYGLLLFCISISSYAQNIPARYQLFTVNEGLPQNLLFGLAQDSMGFIWIGTKDGLARYDGYNFKIYRQGKDAAHSPAFNNVTNLYTDYRGRLWIQYENRGIDCYDPYTGIFDHVSKQPAWDNIRDHLLSHELLVDHQDNLWISTTNGVYRYNIRTKQLTPFKQAPGIIARAMMEDHTGKVWLVTEDQFYIFDHSKEQLQTVRFQLSLRKSYSGRDHKFGIGETESGKVILTSLDSTALVYDPINRTSRTITLKSNKRLVYDAGVGNTNLVASVNGDRWFTCNGRIFRLDKRTDEITELDDPMAPQFPHASALLFDRTGNLWFGKNAEGLCKINMNAPRFVSKNYVSENFQTDILLNEMGATREGWLGAFNHRTHGYLFRNATDNANKLIWMQNYITGLDTPRLMVYDIGRKKVITQNIQISANSEVGITYDHIGNAWAIGIDDWVPYKLNYLNGRIVKQPIDISSSLGDSLFKAGYAAINPVVANGIMWVMATKMNIDFGAWMLVSIDLQSKQVRFYPIAPDNAEPSSSMLMMVSDPSNQKYLWLGTTGNGLVRFDKTTGQSHAFTMDDGLPNNTIYSIVPDEQHNLWLSSNKGITRFNPVTHDIRNFDITDGLISNEFNRWHCFKLPDGRIAFGGIPGYTIFHPADIKDDDYQPEVLLSNLMINNKAVPDSSAITDSSVNALAKLVLPHDQNFLTFEFASDEYDHPQKITYRYRLKNFDDDWVYTRNGRSANYTKLPPGNYTLEVNAANISGIWSSKIKTLQITIVPPWWQTWWAYGVYILIGVLLIVSFFYYRIRRIRLAQEMILQQKQTEQLKAVDEMKTRFFSNITHEFRTPLSLIISPIEKLQSETKDDETRKTLSTVQRNANRLLQLINQLLDLSKLEAGNMQLNFSRGRLDEFTEEMVNLFQPLAERQQIGLTFDCDLSQEYLFDADKLKTIFFNLISNAVKFTPAGGKITATVTEEGNNIKIMIADTGIGIPPGKTPFIFDRFFQADDSRSRRYEGTGIGLALVKELVELMRGSVSAESKEGAGTVITVIFPAEKAAEGDALPWQKEIKKEITLAPFKRLTVTNDRNEVATEANLPLLLLVEDNEELLAFLREAFERNFRVITAVNGLAGLQLAKEELPDVVISDVMMPEMDGYALCRALKTDNTTSHIAVILLTAKASYESRLDGLQLGADDYISKPFHFAELETRIKNILDHQEKQRAHYRAQLRQKQTAEAKPPPFLKNIYTTIDEMIDDPELGASKLAEKSAMSLRTLNRKLHTIIGMTAGDLIRQYRLQKGLALLRAGHNVSEAAYMVGFETPAYFSQCFKDQYGVSPREYSSLC